MSCDISPAGSPMGGRRHCAPKRGPGASLCDEPVLAAFEFGSPEGMKHSWAHRIVQIALVVADHQGQPVELLDVGVLHARPELHSLVDQLDDFRDRSSPARNGPKSRNIAAVKISKVNTLLARWLSAAERKDRGPMDTHASAMLTGIINSARQSGSMCTKMWPGVALLA